MSESARAVKRLLILTSATGAGHDTHAQAVADWCTRLYGSAIEVTIVHALEDSHFLYRWAVNFYNFIQRRAPWFHHLYYNIIELLDALNPGTVGLGREYYIDLLKRIRPDAILSVMDCLNRGYFELAKDVLGRHVKCATYCTEFSGGYGFSRNWVNPRGDFFWARTEETKLEAIRRGFDPGRCLVVGHVAPPPFYDEPLDQNKRASYLRNALRLDPSRFTLLLSTGGASAQNHRDILRFLLPLGNRLQVIALCGRDSVGRERLERWSQKSCPFTVRALGFSNEMHALLQVSSAVVARGGATTAGETLLCECPMIFNAIGGMMPQEMPTWNYFHQRGFGYRLSTAAEIRMIVNNWLERPDELIKIRANIARSRDKTTPKEALGRLLDDL